MGILSWLGFGKKEASAEANETPEALRAEAALVLGQREEFKRTMDRWRKELYKTGVETPKEKVELFERRIVLIQNTSYHPNARLVLLGKSWGNAFSKDYPYELEKAAKGDRQALENVRKYRMTMKNDVARALEQLKKRKEEKEAETLEQEASAASQSQDWAIIKQKEEQEVHKASEHLNALLEKLPGRDVDLNNPVWVNYYMERYRKLTNSMLSLPARLVYATVDPHGEKERLISAYFGFLGEFSTGNLKRMAEFERTKVIMGLIVSNDARRLVFGIKKKPSGEFAA